MSRQERIDLLDRISKLARLIAAARSGRVLFDSEQEFLQLVGLQPEELKVLIHPQNAEGLSGLGR